MKRALKKIIFSVLILAGLGFAFAAAPSFDRNFADYLVDETPDQYERLETVFSICIDRNKTLMENVRNLFYPGQFVNDSSCSNSPGGQIWDVIRVL